VEAVEGAPDVRVIVDADHHLALAAAHEVGHALVLLKRENPRRSQRSASRGVHVEECVCLILALGAGEPGQVLDVSAVEALPRCGKILLDTQQIESRPRSGGIECLSRDLATESVLLKVEEPSSTLDIGQGLRARHILPFDLPRAESPLELAHELLQLVLHNTVKGDQVTVQSFNTSTGAGWGRMKNNAAPPAMTST